MGGGRNQGDANLRLFGKDSNFNQVYVYRGKVCPTLSAKDTFLMHFEAPLYLSRGEVCSVSTFPQDYDFGNESPHYICGMSVPPVMMAQVASRVYQQWLKPINEQ